MKGQTMKAKALLPLLVFVLLCFIGWNVQGQRRRTVVARWEYKVVDAPLRDIGSKLDYETRLNQFGLEGWELISEHQYESSNTIRYTFKRTK